MWKEGREEGRTSLEVLHTLEIADRLSRLGGAREGKGRERKAEREDKE